MDRNGAQVLIDRQRRIAMTKTQMGAARVPASASRNFNPAVRWREAREQIGVPNLHLHDLRHTGNTLAARSGASLRDLMTRMGHDSPAALIYQHSSRVADEAIAAARDARLAERKSRPAPNIVGPMEGPTEPS
jgi:integrase